MTPQKSNVIVNYDGSITTNPKQLVFPQSVQEIQNILRDSSTYPSPVRAKGSYHSLTPCVSSDGTIVDMSRMNKVVQIDKTNNSFTAQAGLEFIEASKALREQGLQFMTNIEIGNMTLGSAACCHTKDALDGIEFGQVSSYVTGVKWVTPAGDLAEASATVNPDLLPLIRSSYGLAGIIYEVTFRVKAIEALHFTYVPRPIDELTQAEVDQFLTAEGLICWTVGRTCVFQQRQKVSDAGILGSLEAAARRRLWNFGVAFGGHIIDEFLKDNSLRDAVQQGGFDLTNFLYSTLHLFGGITLLAPDKTIDYSQTPDNARYAFTFWAFPRSQWLDTMKAYLDFADQHFKATGFRCNMPLGSYHIRKDQNSILSYTWDQEVFSIDPIHAPTDEAPWQDFLRAFNDFAAQRNGIPLLNQSPFVTRQHVAAAYGQRWSDLAKWVRTADPNKRMLNPFFADLLPEMSN
ncbi:MAG TPA: FAD-binding protein [Bryobacteraceae bacterium]|nr:FAD-binding protein [Bryobacteraceae bacterium]